MRILIAEDDPISARYMEGLLSRYGECTVTRDGQEAVDAFELALGEKRPYGLVCLDIMMPLLDGQEALQRIREAERVHGVKPAGEVKVVMTTALGDVRTVMGAYREGATAYITKPIAKDRFLETLRGLGLET